jgi:hypothetical protein
VVEGLLAGQTHYGIGRGTRDPLIWCRDQESGSVKS